MNTAAEMRRGILRFKKADVFISAAAVSDFRPAEQFDGKIKRRTGNFDLRIEKNADILKKQERKNKSGAGRLPAEPVN